MSLSGKNIRINGERLWDSLMDMAEIGPGVAGGNNRQTLTDDDAKGRELFQKWCVLLVVPWVSTAWETCLLLDPAPIQKRYLYTLDHTWTLNLPAENTTECLVF